MPPEAPAAKPRAARTAKTAMAAVDGNAAVNGPTATTTGSGTAPPIPAPTSLLVSFYQVSRNQISEIQREAASGAVTGEAFGGILLKRKLQALKNNGDMRPVSSNRYKLDGMPITLFKGLRAAESAKSVGIYMQMTPGKSEMGSLQIDIKSWGHVKMEEADENLFSSEITIDPQHVSYIAGFLPRDKTFNDEEKSLFESDRALKIYNQDDFRDGQSDLILFVEIPD